MTPADRLAMAVHLSDEVRKLAQGGVRSRLPGASPAQIQAELRTIVLRAAERSTKRLRG
jgi:hypothetical protein